MDFNYPELYYTIFPKVIDTLKTFSGNNISNREISKEDMEEMISNIYMKVIKEYPEIDMDPGERRGRGSRHRHQRSFYSRSKLLIDIITIILLSELLRIKKPYNYQLENYNQMF